MYQGERMTKHNPLNPINDFYGSNSMANINPPQIGDIALFCPACHVRLKPEGEIGSMIWRCPVDTCGYVDMTGPSLADYVD